MSILGFFRKGGTTAPVARERLQILLSHERATRGGPTGRPNLIHDLREEILAVIEKHVTIDRDKVKLRMDRGQQLSTLEIEIEIPNPVLGNAA